MDEYMEGIVSRQGEGRAPPGQSCGGFQTKKLKPRREGLAPAVAQVGWEPGVGARLQLGCR